MGGEVRFTLAKWSVHVLIAVMGASILVLELSRAALRMAVKYL